MAASRAGQYPTPTPSSSPGTPETVDSGASLRFPRFLRRVFGRLRPAATVGRLPDGSK